MKKTVLYVFIVIALMAITFGATYTVMDRRSNDKNDSNIQKENEPAKVEKLETGVKLKDTSKSGNTITKKFEVVMNNKRKDIDVKFTLNKNEISGSLEGTKVYSVLGDTEEYTENIFGNEISKEFDEDNFQFIKGEDDKDYLLVIKKNETPGPIAYQLVVLNDEFKQIKNENLSFSGCDDKDAFTMATTAVGYEFDGSWYENDFDIIKSDADKFGFSDKFSLEIEDDKIYYYQITGNINDTEYKLEKRVYSIKNDQLTYKTLGTYTSKGVAGQAC